MIRIIKGLTIAATLLAVTSVSGKQTIREFRGSDSRVTPEFTVEAPWVLDWRLDGDYDQLVALEVSLIEVETGRNLGQVVYTKRKNNGVRMFDRGGTFQFRVSGSLARWTLKVEQLTDDEAELYTPK